ncbi:SH3 domain-containing protein [Altererythrobacter sp. B11]|uniref:SH3 domain-containing protein n=1 Tax=Altererythrobacter sp. B11 TaxID=2060312 RepID=UPI001E45585E|nr:SH3 domain-containing protein [Altererythrobacter sp. B11]
MQETDKLTNHGPYMLAGPVARPDAGALPLRGDLAHVGLAGRYFVPHYAVPQPRAVMPGGAPLLVSPEEGAAELCTLMEGDSFEVLDITGSWAWGCLSLEGPVGYVHVDRLESLPG